MCVPPLVSWAPMDRHLLAIAVGLAAVLLAALGWLLRTRPWRGARPRFPVVLAHGLFGFDAIGVGGFKQDYFRGVVAHLRGLGVEVQVPAVPPAASIATRAEALAEAVRALPAKKVNIIAHSMGGLDARYAISRLGLSDRVASLITVGTPHRGTPVANAAASVLGELLGLRRWLSGVGVEALFDLTTDHLADFNRSVPDARGVHYACVVGVGPRVGGPVHPLLRPGLTYMRDRFGPNDGVVPAASQRWGKVIATVHADHWAMIGWSDGIDAPALYERLSRKLRSWGL